MMTETVPPGLAGAEGDDVVRGDAVEDGPEVGRERGEVPVRPEHVQDLLLREGAAQPGNRRFVPVLQHALDGVARVGPGIEITEIPSFTASLTSLKPGSEIVGVPAEEIRTISSPFFNNSMAKGILSFSFCSK